MVLGKNMKKLFLILVMAAMVGGCYAHSGYYRVKRIEVHSTHGGSWYEVPGSPGVYHPRHHHRVIVIKPHPKRKVKRYRKYRTPRSKRRFRRHW